MEPLLCVFLIHLSCLWLGECALQCCVGRVTVGSWWVTGQQLLWLLEFRGNHHSVCMLPLPLANYTCSLDHPPLRLDRCAAIPLPQVGEHHKCPGLAPRDEDSFRIIHIDGTHEKRKVGESQATHLKPVVTRAYDLLSQSLIYIVLPSTL